MPYAQLGSTIFDGYKSFVSYSNDEEAVLVEHALINRKAKLQGAGLGLQNITITLYLHQEFCVVKDELDALQKSMQQYEILPLLWGNGTLEGSFVIASINKQALQQDALGNIYAASVSVSLKESVADNVTTPPPQGSATGDTKPVTKSKRSNPTSCNKQMSALANDAVSRAAQMVNSFINLSSAPAIRSEFTKSANIIQNDTASLIAATQTEGSCINGNSDIAAQSQVVSTNANALITTLVTYGTTTEDSTDTVKQNCADLKSSADTLQSLVAATAKNAILGG